MTLQVARCVPFSRGQQQATVLTGENNFENVGATCRILAHLSSPSFWHCLRVASWPRQSLGKHRVKYVRSVHWRSSNRVIFVPSEPVTYDVRKCIEGRKY